MNRYIINMAVVAALMVPSTAAIAQTTHYTPAAEGKYESYMNFTGQVVENGVPVNGEVGGPDNYYYIDLPSPYVRGDANGYGVVNVTDIMGIANIILKVDTNGSRAMREIDDAVEPQ